MINNIRISLTDQEAEAWKRVKESKSVLITSHIHPDGDAIGCCLALARYCESKGIVSTICIDDKISELYQFLPGVKSFKTPNRRFKAETLVVVDTDARRIGRAGEMDVDYIVNLDHHGTNSRECMLRIIRENYSSTAEMLYKLFISDGYEIDKQTAECLYTGLITDTVFFKIPLHSGDPFFIAGDLLLRGVNTSFIAERLSQINLGTFRLSAMAYSKLESFRNNTIVGISLDKEFDLLDSTDEIIDSIRFIEGVEIAYLIKYEKNDSYRVRLRSQKWDLSIFAKQHGGGGHADAAGYTILADNSKKATDILVGDIIKWLA